MQTNKVLQDSRPCFVDGCEYAFRDVKVIIAKIAEFFYSDLKWLSLGDGITFFTSFMRRSQNQTAAKIHGLSSVFRHRRKFR